MMPERGVVISIVAMCLLMGCTTAPDSPSAIRRRYSGYILNGRGEERPEGSSRDYFSAYFDRLADLPALQTTCTAIDFANAFAGGTQYGNLSVAYAVNGRAREAMDAFEMLIRTRFKKDTHTRLGCCEAWLALRRAEHYYWDLGRPMIRSGLMSGYPYDLTYYELDWIRARDRFEEYLLKHDPQYREMTDEVERLDLPP